MNADTNNTYTIFTLSNGMRCVFRRADGKVCYCGVCVNAGSRDETSATQGLAHFVEHTVFKGTAKRSSWNINNRMESIGGELNAYTTKEETLIYTNAPAGNAARSVELLADLVGGCTFPRAEIEREREVVIEEINSYLDSPADSVFDEFEDRIYAGSGLGHNILGTAESVRALTGDDCKRFVLDHYTPQRMTLYIVDAMTPEAARKLAEKHFGGMHHDAASSTRVVPAMAPRFDATLDRDGHQAHTIIGARVFGRDDERRFALFLLNNHLGGPGMNSRLNQLLRERRGYVYPVDSSLALMSDAGLFMVYFGSDRSLVKRCKRLIYNELMRLADERLSPRALERIKRQYVGQLLVSSDNREATAMSLGKSLLYYGEVHDPVWTAGRVAEVTADQIRDVAQLIVPDLCSSLTIC